MSTPTINYSESSLTTAPTELTGSEKRLRWFEVCLVMLVTCGQSFLGSLFIYMHGHEMLPLLQRSSWDTRIPLEVAGLMLLGYVLSRRKRSFRDIGLRWSLRDLGTGLLVTFAAYAACFIGYYAIHIFFQAWIPAVQRHLTARDLYSHPSLIAIPLTLLNPVFEELIVRAYLMTEIGELTGSWLLAVAISTIVQSSYHLYYGWATMLALACSFLIFSIYYAKTRKATPIIVAHAAFDVLALIQLW